MSFRSIAYRLQQVRQQLGFVAPLSEADHQEVANILPSSAAQSLFRTMSPADQQHSLRVCRGLQARGCTDKDMLAAALLHDIGKSQGRVPFWTRPAIVIGKKLAPNLLSRLVLSPEKISPSHWDPITQMNKITRTSAVADDVNEQNNPDTRRGRFIVPTADLSALGDVPCPDSFVNDHYRPPWKSTPSTHQYVKPHNRIPRGPERDPSMVGAIPCGRPARVAGRPAHVDDHPESANNRLAHIDDRPALADGSPETIHGRPFDAAHEPPALGHDRDSSMVGAIPCGRPVAVADHPTSPIPKWRQSLSNAWYHADIGAQLASAAGLSDRAVLYIRTHHQPNGPAAALYEVDEVS